VEITIFCCAKSLLARVWIISAHFLFALYLISLPLDTIWSVALAVLCFLLALRDYRKLPSGEFFLAYFPDGRWSYRMDQMAIAWPEYVQLKLAHHNPLMMVIAIVDKSGQKKDSLLVWRDSLEGRKWRQLRAFLNY